MSTRLFLDGLKCGCVSVGFSAVALLLFATVAVCVLYSVISAK